MDEEKGFRISNIFYYILKGRKLIAIFALAGLIIGIILSGINYLRGQMSKEYQIVSSIAIIAQTRSGTYASTKSNPDTEDVRLAQEITDSAIYVLKSKRTLETAIENANLTGVSIKDIQDNLTLSQYNETQIIEMTLYWRSNAEGVRILEAINDVSGEILLETLKIGNVSVVNSPTSRYIIGGSVSASTWIISSFVGLAIGVIICILKLLIMPTFTNRKDIVRFLGLEVLGTVAQEKDIDPDTPFAPDDTQMKKNIDSLVNILANRMERAGRHKLYLTSTGHQEGRTRLAVNIADRLAAAENKTLLIDCDLKNPQLSTLFKDKFRYENTLNALYKGTSDKTDAITHIKGCLDLLPYMLEDEPLVMNGSLLNVISDACEGYDYVVIDAAPVGDDTEVIKLNKIADTAIFVLRFDQEEISDIGDAVTRLKESGMLSIGCIVNGIKTLRDVLRDAQQLTLFRHKKKAGKKSKADSAS